MKKVLILAALVLGMASCQKDFAVENESHGEVPVTLSVATPELGITRAGVDGEDDGVNGHDSAYGAIDYFLDADWANVDLRYSLEVYDEADLTTPVKDRMVQIVDKYQPVKFELRLIPNREYRFVVFADFVDDGLAGATVNPHADVQKDLGLRHTIGANLTKIAVKEYDENGKLIDAINDELADAYFKKFTYKPTNNTQNNINDSQDVILQRPYGKVRVVATDLAELNLNVDPKSVVVTYNNVLVPTTFNAVTGVIGTETSSRTFTFNYVDDIRTNRVNHVYNVGYDAMTSIADNGAERASHLTLFTDYILASEQQHAISFVMTTYDESGEPIKAVDFNTNIPVQRNHLTTIIGNVLTAANEVTVKIDDNFANAGKDERPFYQVAVSTGYEFVKAFYEGREIILQGNITVTEDDVNAYLATRAGAAINPVLNLNGFTITFVNNGDDALLTVAEGSSLTIEDNVGTGAVVLEGDGNAIENNGELIINNTTLTSNGEGSVIENNAEVNIEGSTLNEGAVENNGEANIADSTLNAGSVENNGTANLNGGDVADDAVENGENAIVGTYVYNADELQAAINAAVKTDVVNEISFGANIAGNVTIVEKPSVKITINGRGFNYDGSIKVHSNSYHYADAALTIKDVNFETATASVNFVEALENGSQRYSTNITVEDCTFTATGEAVNTAVGVQIKSSKNAKVLNCTATDMHSLIQAQSCDETVVVKGCTINGKNGVAFKQVKAATVEGTTIVATGYGIRFDGNIDNYGIVVKNNNVTAYQPLIVRKMTGKNNTIALEGENTLTTEQAYQIVITNGSDDEKYVVPTGTYTLTGFENFKYYPMPIAMVGNTEYVDIDEAIAAWTNNTTLTLMSDVTLSDVITLKSTEHHILNLSTYTLTAASGKNAIEITPYGDGAGTAARSCLTINADANNPGQIAAGSKACIYYKKTNSINDRIMVTINGGIYNGTISSSSNNGGQACPYFVFNGGVFNKSISLTKAMLKVTGGIFHGMFSCTGDSTAHRLISGGTFKSFTFMTADAANKFCIGTDKQTYNVGLYINDEGYLVVGGPVITEFGDKFAAKATNATKWSSYLQYSSAAANGLYYTNAEMAIKKHGEANVVLK